MSELKQPTLQIDLERLKSNFRELQSRRTDAETACVVKANAYGLGVKKIAPALAKAGCTTFFVAYTFEGVALRQILNSQNFDARICVFNGPSIGESSQYLEYNLTPVLNSLCQIQEWASTDKECLLHIDTGMNRLGLAISDAYALLSNNSLFGSLKITEIISHFTSSSLPSADTNADQISTYQNLLSAFQEKSDGIKGSLSASGGLFLENTIEEKLTRPGVALYGIGPHDQVEDSLENVASLYAPVLQTRWVEKGERAGYCGTWQSNRKSRIATIGIGYADGYLRALSNKGIVSINGQTFPVIGNVSMDLITIDITDAKTKIEAGDAAELFGDNIAIEELAEKANTIAYELLSLLGDRVVRRYK